MADNPLAKWLFESSPGLLLDSSGNSQTLTGSGTPTADTTYYKEGSQSINFARASSQYAYRADADLMSGFPLKSGDAVKTGTWGFWFYPVTLAAGTYYDIASKSSTTNANKSLSLYNYGTTLRLTWYYGTSGSAYTWDLTTLQTSRWYWIGISFNGVNKNVSYRIWDDTAGSYIATGTKDTNDIGNVMNVGSARFTLGNVEGGTNYLTGKLDSFWVFDRQLGWKEMDALRAATWSTRIDVLEASQVLAQVEYDTFEALRVYQVLAQVEVDSGVEKVSQLLAQIEYEEPAAIKVSQLIVQIEYEPGMEDGVSSGGIVFGGVSTDEWHPVTPHVEAVCSGGIVYGGASIDPPTNYMTEEPTTGGIVFGGDVVERWVNPWVVAVKGGNYRIAGTIYILPNIMYYEGLGDIAELVDVGLPPSTTGYFRYDLLSIDVNQVIAVTVGTEALIPIMPAVPVGEVKLDHVLRFEGQTYVAQSDIGRLWEAPRLSTIVATAGDDDLAWPAAPYPTYPQIYTDISVVCYDQYGTLYSGGVVLNASFLIGNGLLSPTSRSGRTHTFSFRYTRYGLSNDSSPTIQFASDTGPLTIEQIILRSATGDIMV